MNLAGIKYTAPLTDRAAGAESFPPYALEDRPTSAPAAPRGRCAERWGGSREENCCLTSDRWITKGILSFAQDFHPDDD